MLLDGSKRFRVSVKGDRFLLSIYNHTMVSVNNFKSLEATTTIR